MNNQGTSGALPANLRLLREIFQLLEQRFREQCISILLAVSATLPLRRASFLLHLPPPDHAIICEAIGAVLRTG
jgi:hypothetical protein